MVPNCIGTVAPLRFEFSFCRPNRLRVFENRILRRIFGPKRDEVTGEWRKLHNEELHNLYSSPDIKANEVGGACCMHGRGEKSVQGFGGKARRKETTGKTKV
jgi:hypothetical protein